MAEHECAPQKGDIETGDVVALLGKLAHRGAYLSFRCARGATAQESGEEEKGKVYSPQNDFAKPVLVIGQHVAHAAASQGLISPGCVNGRQRISLSGARLLKAVRSAGSDGAVLAGANEIRKNCKSRSKDVANGAGTRKGSDDAILNTSAASRRFIECVLDPGSSRTVTIDAAESPLGWLRRRKGRDGLPMIDDAQFQAGERLRSEFSRGQMCPRVTANWSSVTSSRRCKSGGPGGASDMNDGAVAARQRVRRALEAVGPELSGVLIDVCCYLKGIEVAERGSGWPQRSGKVVLLLALDALARHYGLIASGGARQRQYARMLHWGAADYKPAMDVE